ncbi:MAG: hypothetical protein ACPGVG_13670, partial [Mycobacterium sp.]
MPAKNTAATASALADAFASLSVEGKPVTSGSLWDWSAKIRGLRGTRLALHIQRKGWKKARR